MKQIITICILLIATSTQAQLTTPKQTFTKADTLRGSNNENRNWWDVLRYDINVKPNFEKKEIEGMVAITFKSNIDITDEVFEFAKNIKETKNGNVSFKTFNYDSPNDKDRFMQIDLQEGMEIDLVLLVDSFFTKANPISNEKKTIKKDDTFLNFFKNDGVYLIEFPAIKTLKNLFNKQLLITFHGKPKEAVKPPWDGGWVWAKDKLGRPFVSVACQGLGASCWFPCKDYQGDEPNNGASLTIVVPDSLVGVSNGFLLSKNKVEKNVELEKAFKILQKLMDTIAQKNNMHAKKDYDHSYNIDIFKWQVKNPINTYCIVPYIGNYINFTDTFIGEKGILDLSYWVLDYNKEKAQEQFKQVKPMLKAFEYWFGAYPFYEDGYKLVEAPYLGMEHQSAIAYGNDFKNGYKGKDLSGSCWGLKWDFIIVHESGHEWFANSITTKDIADMWVHEGFTNYSEVLFTEYYYGKEAANDYCYGLRNKILNDAPIIGHYGVNKEGSGDMYWKASNMIHSIRNALNDDEKFRKILRGMNERFYHKTVDGSEIKQYLIEQTKLDLQSTFDQYLTTTQIPQLEYYFTGKKFFYKYSNCINGFNMPITIPFSNKTIVPTTEWQHKRFKQKNKEWFTNKNVERLYLLKCRNSSPTTLSNNK